MIHTERSSCRHSILLLLNLVRYSILRSSFIDPVGFLFCQISSLITLLTRFTVLNCLLPLFGSRSLSSFHNSVGSDLPLPLPKCMYSGSFSTSVPSHRCLSLYSVLTLLFLDSPREESGGQRIITEGNRFG